MTQVLRQLKSHPDGQGGWQRPRGFVFDATVCAACDPCSPCIASKKGKGRTVSLHPQQALLQQVRALQRSEAFAEYQKRRQVSEHRLARLVQLGISQARYLGRLKTLFQLWLAATVANLTLVATKRGMTGRPSHRAASFLASLHQHFLSVAKIIATSLEQFLAAIQPSRQSTRKTLVWIGGCRPDF